MSRKRKNNKIGPSKWNIAKLVFKESLFWWFFGNMSRGFIKTLYFLLFVFSEEEQNNAICYPTPLMLCLNRLDQRVVVKRSGLPTLLSTPSHRWPVAFYFLFSLPPLWCWLGLVAGTRILCSEFLLTLPSVLLHLLARIPTLALLAAYWCFFGTRI